MGSSAKCSTIRHIVRLRQMLRRWRARACSPYTSRRRRSGNGRSSSPPADVPAGHVAVCVGTSSRRFVVRTTYLNHPVFRTLLVKAEEEYGFSARPGPIAIPCDESLFEEILRHLSSSSSARFTGLEHFQSGGSGGCHVAGGREGWQEGLPLLRGGAAEDSSVW